MIFGTMLNHPIQAVPNHTKAELGWFSYGFRSELWTNHNRAKPNTSAWFRAEPGYLAWFQPFPFKMAEMREGPRLIFSSDLFPQ